MPVAATGGQARGGIPGPRSVATRSPRTAAKWPAAPTAAWLLRTFAGQNHAHGLEQNDDVEEQRMVLDVVEVVLQLLYRVVERGAVVVADLRPPGHPGLDAVPHR